MHVDPAPGGSRKRIGDFHADVVELEDVGFEVDRVRRTVDGCEQAREILLAVFQQLETVAAENERAFAE